MYHLQKVKCFCVDERITFTRVVHSLYYGQAGALSIMNKAQRATDLDQVFFLVIDAIVFWNCKIALGIVCADTRLIFVPTRPGSASSFPIA